MRVSVRKHLLDVPQGGGGEGGRGQGGCPGVAPPATISRHAAPAHVISSHTSSSQPCPTLQYSLNLTLQNITID